MGITFSFLYSKGFFLRTACALSLIAMVAGEGASASFPSRVESLSNQMLMADDYYLGRERLSNVQQGIDLLRRAANDNPRDYEAWWRLARFQNFLGRRTQDDRTAASIYGAGAEAARRAVALEPNRVEGHFWLGANYGLMAEAAGWIKGLRFLDTVRSEMETVIRLDPGYEANAGERTLARIFYRAPFFKGGDKQRSIELLQDCLKRYPHDSFAMLYLADDYVAVGRRVEARALLEQILGLCPDPLYGPELENNQAEARERLQQEFRAAR